jgi:hypothetical protein
MIDGLFSVPPLAEVVPHFSLQVAASWAWVAHPAYVHLPATVSAHLAFNGGDELAHGVLLKMLHCFFVSAELILFTQLQEP